MREDPKPPERIVTLPQLQYVRRDRPSADAVEAVTAGDEIGAQLTRLPAVAVVHERLAGPRGVEPHVLHLEQQGRSAGETRLDQVLDDLGLAVDRDRASSQLVDRDMGALGVEL